MKTLTKTFTREDNKYLVTYKGDGWIETIVNEKTGATIPKHTQTFRRINKKDKRYFLLEDKDGE